MIEKMPHTIGNRIVLLKYGFGRIGRKYRPISVLVSVWDIIEDLNQNSGFGCTLVYWYIGHEGFYLLKYHNAVKVQAV